MVLQICEIFDKNINNNEFLKSLNINLNDYCQILIYDFDNEVVINDNDNEIDISSHYFFKNIRKKKYKKIFLNKTLLNNTFFNNLTNNNNYIFSIYDLENYNHYNFYYYQHFVITILRYFYNDSITEKEYMEFYKQNDENTIEYKADKTNSFYKTLTFDLIFLSKKFSGKIVILNTVYIQNKISLYNVLSISSLNNILISKKESFILENKNFEDYENNIKTLYKEKNECLICFETKNMLKYINVCCLRYICYNCYIKVFKLNKCSICNTKNNKYYLNIDFTYINEFYNNTNIIKTYNTDKLFHNYLFQDLIKPTILSSDSETKKNIIVTNLEIKNKTDDNFILININNEKLDNIINNNTFKFDYIFYLTDNNNIFLKKND